MKACPKHGCEMRIGKILNIEEYENPQHVPDKEFCFHRKDGKCYYGAKHDLRK